VTDLPPLLWTLPDRPAAGRVLLAHGAGAGSGAPFMVRLAEALAAEGLATARFDFAYMAGRAGGKRRPPPKAERLVDEMQAALRAVLAAPEASGPVLIAGKSMGGRVAAMTAGGDLPADVVGAVAYGYPFRPPDGGDWRLAPLADLRRPLLICQGERDAFGGRAELAETPVPGPVEIVWIEDGSHDFGPRGQSPATLKGNIAAAARATAAFLDRLAGRTSDRPGESEPS
jgi:predicted alpha/beta-hydrolase family hydrolase